MTSQGKTICGASVFAGAASIATAYNAGTAIAWLMAGIIICLVAVVIFFQLTIAVLQK